MPADKTQAHPLRRKRLRRTPEACEESHTDSRHSPGGCPGELWALPDVCGDGARDLAVGDVFGERGGECSGGVSARCDGGSLVPGLAFGYHDRLFGGIYDLFRLFHGGGGYGATWGTVAGGGIYPLVCELGGLGVFHRVMARARSADVRAAHESVVGSDEEQVRLDRWFKRHYPTLSHAYLHKLIRTGQVRVDGARCRPGQRLCVGQSIRVPPLPSLPATEPSPSVGGDLRKYVLYRDESFIVLNKPTGLAVQGGVGVVRSLDAMLDSLRFSAKERPRLVHRLDKDTSGVLTLARTLPVARYMASAFRRRAVRKLYWALTDGAPEPPKGVIHRPVARRADAAGRGEQGAYSRYAVLAQTGDFAWLALWLFTGRRHQARLHAASLGTPIVGDARYGRRKPPLYLHARGLQVDHPDGGRLSVVAPMPEHMQHRWKSFGWDPDRASF